MGRACHPTSPSFFAARRKAKNRVKTSEWFFEYTGNPRPFGARNLEFFGQDRYHEMVMPLSPVREITSLELPSLHTRRTPLEIEHPELRTELDLNFPGTDTQHSTHALHTYVAAINPPLARHVIEHYVPRGETILDPFCGGGGVMVEAILSGRGAWGSDVNPLAVLLSSAKTTQIDMKRTQAAFFQILERVSSGECEPLEVPEVVSFWYLPESLPILCRLRDAVLKVKDESVRTLFRVVLSATARDVMLTYRGEIRLRRMTGKDLEKFQPDVLASFKKRALVAIARVDALPKGASAKIELCDCRELSADKVHSVITSPPYADDTNGVGYFQFSRNMMFWVGVPLDFQKTQRRSFLGGGHGLPTMEHVEKSETLRRVLEVIGSRKRAHHIDAAAFYGDYYRALENVTAHALERAIVIIGNRVLSRTTIDNGHITTEFMDALGFRLEHYYSRELKKKRIANLGGDGGGTSIEHVLVYHRG